MRKVPFVFGFGCQIFFWFAALLALYVVLLLETEIEPFRYLGF